MNECCKKETSDLLSGKKKLRNSVMWSSLYSSGHMFMSSWTLPNKHCCQTTPLGRRRGGTNSRLIILFTKFRDKNVWKGNFLAHQGHVEIFTEDVLVLPSPHST